MVDVLFHADHHVGSVTREPDWSSICNNIFDEYMPGEDPFGLTVTSPQADIFDLRSSSIEQSLQTSHASPKLSQALHTRHHTSLNAQQPRAQAPGNFWLNKVQALEQCATRSEREHQLHAPALARSHSDFVTNRNTSSLQDSPPSSYRHDGFPSLHVQKSRVAANGSRVAPRQSSGARALSNGRPSGVVKSSAMTGSPAYATVRRRVMSPVKMRASTRLHPELQYFGKPCSQPAGKLSRSPMISRPFTASPQVSMKDTQCEFAAFGASGSFPQWSMQDSLYVPMVSQQHTRIVTPQITSPSYHSVLPASTAQLDSAPYFSNDITESITDPEVIEPVGLVNQDNNQVNAVPPANDFQGFNFGFNNDSDLDLWSATSMPDASTMPTAGMLDVPKSVPDFDSVNDPTSFPAYGSIGLGISCEPDLVSMNEISQEPLYSQPPNVHTPHMMHNSVFPELDRLPHTPHYSVSPQHNLAANMLVQSHLISPSPSPALLSSTQTLARNHLLPTDHTSLAAHHRRHPSRTSRPHSSSPMHSDRIATSAVATSNPTNTSTTTSRRHPNIESGGFVNYTPQHRGQILNGVAPSGSSKTKLRREKEAEDKRRREAKEAEEERRKIGQAAMRAIVEAGGDPMSLTRAGLDI